VVTLLIDLPEKSNYQGFSIRDLNGAVLPFVEIDRKPFGTLVRNLQDISLQLRSQRIYLHAEFKDIPALGYKTYSVKKEKKDIKKLPVVLSRQISNAEMENEYLKIIINRDGSLGIFDKITGYQFANQHYFEESGESGHPWIHMAPEKDEIFTTFGKLAAIDHVETSELLSRYRVKHEMKVPVGLEGKKGNYSRSSRRIDMLIESTLTLRKRQRWLEVNTKMENVVEQHRVRVCFPTNLQASVSAAEVSFDVVERPIVRTPENVYYGKENPQYPMCRFVDVSDGKIGLAIFNDGIREFEAVDNEERTLCITLLRGFTAMQSPVIDQWDVYPWMKLAQQLGEHEWRYAIYPHAGHWEAGEVYQEVEKFNLPLEAAQAGKGGGDFPKQLGFFEIQPKEIVLSAMKKSEHRDTLILRLFNPTTKEIQGRIITYFLIKEAWQTNMNEESQTKLNPDKNEISITFAKKKIITIEVVF
jgi:alpha-mannosidase